MTIFVIHDDSPLLGGPKYYLKLTGLLSSGYVIVARKREGEESARVHECERTREISCCAAFWGDLACSMEELRGVEGSAGAR